MATRRNWMIIGAVVLLAALAGYMGAQPALLQSKEEKKHFPEHVLIIRHGEKPPEESKSVDLNAEGKERANNLHELFKASTKRPDPFPKPDFIFATKNTKHSHRPLETVTPLAKRLNLPINANYADAEYPQLADEILKNSKYAGKTILISWHHGMIPQLATKLGATGTPEHWKGTVFDHVWRINYNAQGKTTFSDLPQHLLPKDSEK